MPHYDIKVIGRDLVELATSTLTHSEAIFIDLLLPLQHQGPILTLVQFGRVACSFLNYFSGRAAGN
jgi:hypothetical protein